jgi:8-oxo-dGTP pyrophosphatase MutT (NUDIX family)
MPEDIWSEHGDHALNAGMEPVQPLTPAAVLVPLIERPDELTVLFTQRTSHLAHHAGQVSFPGGHIEPQDGGPTETALRETEEEVGLDRRHVTLIGHLDTYITRTGFVVMPVVGIVSPPFTLKPDPHEVAEIFEVPLSFLLNRRNHQRCTAEFEGVARHFWALSYGRHFIWGATAGMLINFCDILDAR